MIRSMMKIRICAMDEKMSHTQVTTSKRNKRQQQQKKTMRFVCVTVLSRNRGR